MSRYILLVIVFFITPGVNGQQILSQASDTSTPEQYAKVEWVVTTNGNFNNPFEAREVMDMVIESPSGKELVLPCFYETKTEKINFWKARFTPQEAGVYRYKFQLTAQGKKINSSRQQTLKVLPSDKDGILHPGDFWTFRFDSGKPFRGIGENVGWESRSFEKEKW